MRDVEFTDTDEAFLITPNDLAQFKQFETVPFENGKVYNYVKGNNDFGLFAMYETIIREPNSGKEINWNARANRFQDSLAIAKLYNRLSLLKNRYPDNLVSVDLQELGADDGFCIHTETYFQIEIKRNFVLCGISMEGDHQIQYTTLIPILMTTLDALEDIDL